MLKHSFFLLLLLVVGCAGSCISVGGAWKDVSGEFTYCFDKEKSKEAGAPVIVETDAQGEKSEWSGFLPGELQQILDKLGVVRAQTNWEESPARRLRNLLERE